MTLAEKNSQCLVGETCSLPSEFSRSLSSEGHNEACKQLEMGETELKQLKKITRNPAEMIE